MRLCTSITVTHKVSCFNFGKSVNPMLRVTVTRYLLCNTLHTTLSNSYTVTSKSLLQREFTPVYSIPFIPYTPTLNVVSSILKIKFFFKVIYRSQRNQYHDNTNTYIQTCVRASVPWGLTSGSSFTRGVCGWDMSRRMNTGMTLFSSWRSSSRSTGIDSRIICICSSSWAPGHEGQRKLEREPSC